MWIVPPLIGGALIGLAASIAWWSDARIAGVSGILSEVLRTGAGAPRWQVGFVAGMLGVGVILGVVWPAAFDAAPIASVPQLAVAGLLVGVGTRLGNGCTSGHGICGLSRFSPRSLAAVVTFMAAGFAVATALSWGAA